MSSQSVQYGKSSPLQIRQKRVELSVVPPQVYIFWSAWAEIQKLISLAAPGEITALGIVRVIDGKLVITDVEYIGGDDTMGFTDIQEYLSNYMIEMDRQGRADEQLALVHLWFHSHGDGDVFWSPIDENTMNHEVIQDYLIAIVGNTRGEMACHVSVFRPVFMAFDGLPLQLWEGPGDDKSFHDAMTEAVTTFNQYRHAPGLLERWFGKPGKPLEIYGPSRPVLTEKVTPGKVVTAAEARHERPDKPTTPPAPEPKDQVPEADEKVSNTPYMDERGEKGK
jgi:hypothetical protein